MIYIEPFQPEHLPQLRDLINTHMGTLVPGWALPEAFIASRLQRNPGEYVVDPWIAARVTLCAIERQRVVAAAHLLRYGGGVEVHPDFRSVGEIAWLLAWPEAAEATAALLAAARQQLMGWGVAEGWAMSHADLGGQQRASAPLHPHQQNPNNTSIEYAGESA